MKSDSEKFLKRSWQFFTLLIILILPTKVISANSYGTYLGEFDGVAAYSNGNSSYYSGESNYINGTYTGIKWQCVEYVRKYYLNRYGIDLGSKYLGDANTWFSNASTMGLSSYPNGSTTIPQIGDILVSNGGSYGHIAIVRSVSNNQVCTIQQNFSNDIDDVNRCLTLTYSSGSYTVGGFSANYPVTGWLRNTTKIAFASNRDGNSEIYVMNPDGTNQTRLTNNPADDSGPSWSPDGNKIAFQSDRDGNYEIYVMNADGTNQVRLTNNTATDFQPAWSPDGSKLAFRTYRDGNSEVYVMNADGTNPVNLTNHPDNYDGEPRWSPDGIKVAFSSWRGGAAGIWVMNADGTNPLQLTGSWTHGPSWSPDSTKIAYSGYGNIFVMNTDGTNQTSILNVGCCISPYVGSWSPDGTKIVIFSDRFDGNYEIYTINSDGTNRTRLTNNSAGDYSPSWSSPLSFTEDADGDGLLDIWEEFGYYSDNGVFVDLPAMGSDKNHKDIFVEVDYMADNTHTHLPTAAGLQTVINVFNNAPVSNPDGTAGIHIHIDTGPNSIMNPATGEVWGALSRATALAHTDTLGGIDANGNYDWTTFQTIKTGNTNGEPNFEQARLPIFHYVIFAHNLGGLGTTSGISRNTDDFSQGASDFIVSLGSWTNSVGSDNEQAGTFIHEFGHNLGLRHGGSDHFNYKPNYLSVMNYSFQTHGLIIGGTQGHFDYSRFTPPLLDENNLNETVGLNGGQEMDNYGTIWYCHFLFDLITITRNTITVNDPINWNCDFDANDNPAVANINYGPNSDGAGSALMSQNDWDYIVYKGGAIGNSGARFSDDPLTTPWINELDFETDRRIGTSTAFTVMIDIKPGSYPNSIKLSDTGAIPVAIFSTQIFDATTIDPATINLNSAYVRLRGKGYAASFEDVNQDGIVDLVVQVDRGSFLNTGNDIGTLEGYTYEGLPIKGIDSVRVIE